MGRDNYINAMPFICECISYVQVQDKCSWESQGKCLIGFPRVIEAMHHLGRRGSACFLWRMGPTQRTQPQNMSSEELLLWKTSPKMVIVKCLEMLLSGMVPRPQAAPDLRFPCSPTPLVVQHILQTCLIKTCWAELVYQRWVTLSHSIPSLTTLFTKSSADTDGTDSLNDCLKWPSRAFDCM